MEGTPTRQLLWSSSRHGARPRQPGGGFPSRCALEGTDPHPGLKNETDEMQQCEMDERDGAEFIARQFSHVKTLNPGEFRIQRGFMVGVVFFYLYKGIRNQQSRPRDRRDGRYIAVVAAGKVTRYGKRAS
jgi:hypothetical protein